MKKLAGVFTATKKDGTKYYRASITYRGRHISLGSYENAEIAHEVYVEARRLLQMESRDMEDLEPRLLPFEKAVILTNFKRNDIYIGTPIFIRPTYFQYFLSKDHVLTFDIDDLFYYAKRKIMKRGGHLFVCDYGMQVNILNRYGIKNFAVIDRDYRFINGDCTDFRYENIEVINRYFGVQRIGTQGNFSYRVKIHVNGDYLVGVYQTEDEAAIAYNKAVDLLKSRGSKKNYTFNYLEHLNGRQYALLYTAVRISNKLSSLIIHKADTQT